MNAMSVSLNQLQRHFLDVLLGILLQSPFIVWCGLNTYLSKSLLCVTVTVLCVASTVLCVFTILYVTITNCVSLSLYCMPSLLYIKFAKYSLIEQSIKFISECFSGKILVYNWIYYIC